MYKRFLLSLLIPFKFGHKTQTGSLFLDFPAIKLSFPAQADQETSYFGFLGAIFVWTFQDLFSSSSALFARLKKKQV